MVFTAHFCHDVCPRALKIPNEDVNKVKTVIFIRRSEFTFAQIQMCQVYHSSLFRLIPGDAQSKIYRSPLLVRGQESTRQMTENYKTSTIRIDTAIIVLTSISACRPTLTYMMLPSKSNLFIPISTLTQVRQTQGK